MKIILIVIGVFGWNPLCVLLQIQKRQYLNFGEVAYIQNPGFDQGKYYSAGVSYEWTLETASNYVFDISCSPIVMPQSNNCNQDRLVISLTGDKHLNDGQRFCGSNPVKLTSLRNVLTIGFHSAEYSSGGLFRCVVTPIVSSYPTETPPETTTEPDCECGWSHKKRIVGGYETAVNEFPFMAALINPKRRVVTCGASIISDRYALTAAHCIYQTESTRFGLLVGDHNLTDGSETDKAWIYKINNYILHEFYNPSTQENDIAMVRTLESIVFSMEVGPICLPHRYLYVNFTYAPVTVMGWGLHEYAGRRSEFLQAADLFVVSDEICQEYYKREIIDDSKVCTFAEGRDSCQHDSGGPVIWYDDVNTLRYQLLGVISLGFDCASDAPGVNTKVSHYFDWIRYNSLDAEYCLK